ncbi:family 43 glycosylhydrolase [Polymorphospora sp. NPDC050346]|uniref:family 43 glycosylhydrolase n=1 Tax=Polymorphospora sp. NPDC050346 TaxID=3155780 RepID=UPI0033D7540D
MLSLPDSWVWDCWIVDDGEQYHLFFLFASRALHDPERRHRRAAIGHATSTDLKTWTRVADALVPSDAPAFDDLATWTGSIIKAPDAWYMFYTGTTDVNGHIRQQIGLATSTDLMTWHKAANNPILTTDPRWYEPLGDGWPDEHWRDPWVLADPDGDGWHMLITTRANHGPVDDRGVIGHATSPDLLTWQVQPPLSQSGTGFGQLEVPQIEKIDNQFFLVFSCLRPEFAHSRQRDPGSGGTWLAHAASPLGPYNITDARPLTDDTLYAGRITKDRNGRHVIIAFHNRHEGTFIGVTSDPIPFPDIPPTRATEPESGRSKP